MAASTPPSSWIAYHDDGAYWLERKGLPSLIICTFVQPEFESLIAHVRGTSAHINYLTDLHIKDPVHGYTRIPPPLTPLLESRYLQRLRYLRQNGPAYLVFPSLQASRFEHSLGSVGLAAHAARSLFTHSSPSDISELSNACIDQLDAQLAYFATVGTTASRPDLVEELKSFEDWCYAEEGEPAYLIPIGNLEGPARRLIARKTLALHVIKITACFYALLHDVGHLPFSHTLEEPLETLLEAEHSKWHDAFLEDRHSWSAKLHERLSIAIVQQEGASFPTEFWQRCTLLAAFADRNLKWKSSSLRALFGVVHSLVSADVDIDRLDFIMRDGYESGAVLANYDLDRILEAVTVIAEGSKAEPTFQLAFDDHAIGDLESVILSRGKLYATIAQHHKVRFFDAAIGRCFEMVGAPWLEAALGECEGSAEALSIDYETVATVPVLRLKVGNDELLQYKQIRLDRLLGCAEAATGEIDDAWALRFLRERRPAHDSTLEGLYECLRETVLLRSRRAFTLYRRLGEFLELRHSIFGKLTETLNELPGERSSGGGSLARRMITPRDVQRFLISVATSRDDDAKRGMRWMIRDFTESWYSVIKERSQTSACLRECAGLVGQNVASVPHDLADLKLRVGELVIPLSEVSGVLRRVAGMPNEIGYFVYLVWLGTRGEEPWRDRKDPSRVKDWRNFKKEAAGVFLEALAKTVGNYFRDHNETAWKVFDDARKKRSAATS